ncbi:MAG: cell division protein SepF [Atopobiaceae bacterium]|jgi:cell division inhibitor SepF|nr:cell division protein SepF [Atopobiaceae bacterium]MCH4180482.1 cell division protein SepF [Atopobiaceae bacterium]MCH4214176.1 cell division protein SepF [Atopobiaceae bacterium]MCH4229479.1 cell division protein SepF [Atopobiaceae bacterium]MCH4275842.1 cell division protein SepF [Atopobiaceae bacterium]
MGFLNNLRDKLRSGSDDDGYYDDAQDGYDQYYDDQDPSGGAYGQASNDGVLGNTSRPEADSVSVYTRSGRPVTGAPSYSAPAATTTSWQTLPSERDYDDAPDARGYADPSVAPQQPVRVPSGQLPPYVLAPTAYDDVQTVVRRVRTNQPVVLSFKGLQIEVATRVLDFCLGFSCGIDGSVQELGDRVFVVLPAGITLSQADLDKLAQDGTLGR